MTAPHTEQLASRTGWSLATAINDALRRGLDNTRPGRTVSPNDASSDPPAAVSPADDMAPMPGQFTKPASWDLVIQHARCADGGLDPDQWFPVSADPGLARQEAAAAIAICMTCPVRGHCLALSLQHWDIGQHGVWGGLVAADRARLHRWSGTHAGQGPGGPLPRQPQPAAGKNPRRSHRPSSAAPFSVSAADTLGRREEAICDRQ